MNEEPIFGNRYQLFWRCTRPSYVGEVRNYVTNGKGWRIVPVRLDDALMRRISMRFLVTSWGNRGAEITVSDAFMALPLNFSEAGIWHEIGHIHHEHHFNAEFSDQTQLRAARIAAVENGQVIRQEAEADRFALERVGKDAMIGFLTHLLSTRPTGGESGWNDAGRRELMLRIDAIQAL